MPLGGLIVAVPELTDQASFAQIEIYFAHCFAAG